MLLILISIVLLWIFNFYLNWKTVYNNAETIQPDEIKTGDLLFGYYGVRRYTADFIVKMARTFPAVRLNAFVSHVGICYRCPNTNQLFVIHIMIPERDEPLRMKYPMGHRRGLIIEPFELVVAYRDYNMICPINKEIDKETLENGMSLIPEEVKSAEHVFRASLCREAGLRDPIDVRDESVICSEYIYKLLVKCGVYKDRDYTCVYPPDLLKTEEHEPNPDIIEYNNGYNHGCARRLYCPIDSYYGELVYDLQNQLKYPLIDRTSIFYEKLQNVLLPEFMG